jgi:transcriptional regulator GlxA family with amidase domain
MIDVTVLLLGGCYASTALGPVEVFHSAGTLWNVLQGNRESPRFRITTASLRSKRVMSPYGVRLQADAEIREIRATGLIIVPSAGLELDVQLAAHSEMYPWLPRHAAKGAYIAGVCSGAAYLAEAGLLDGREATTHWASAQELQRRYPAVKWRPDKMITEDRRVLCSGGVYASIDLSLYLVEKFCGHEIALQIAKSLVINMPRVRQTGYAVLPLSRPHDDDTIRSAEVSIERNFKRRLRVEDLARERHMSPRNFIRRFKAATGRTPGDYLQATRIANDISVTVSKVPAFLHDIDAIVAEHYPDFEIVWFGHIGDGNLHLNILKPENLSKDEFFAKCTKVNKWVFETVLKYNGSISAEHGVGMTKRDYLHYSRSAAEIGYMKAIKAVFDPNGIMNPGKIFQV